MLREDRRAHIEKQLQSKTPIYESERVARFFTKQVVTGWNETYVYELSSGKPTAATARAQSLGLRR